MTLNEAKALLDANNIVYSELHFDSVAQFRLHLSPFANLNNTGLHPVILLEISSNNGHKNIELQFIDENNDGNFTFLDLYFGEFCFEMFDYKEEMLANDLLKHINKIKGGAFSVIVANDLKNKKWLADSSFDLKDDDDLFGKHGFEKAVQKIHAPKGFISKLLKTKKQYEIYDWNTYQCIVK